jgi:hypothetical protein
VGVKFAPGAAGVSLASLRVTSNDPDTPVLSVSVRGLGLAGRFGALEPSLQRVLDVLEIPVTVGDGDVATSKLDGPAGNEEVAMPLLKKAGPGAVRMTMLASFSWEFDPVARFGWYRAKGSLVRRELFTLPSGQSQRLMPTTKGMMTFDPKDWTFGLYSSWLIEPHGDSFSQDELNTWDTSVDRGHKVRFYPYRTPSGRTVANSYVVAMEEGLNSDFEDAVMVIENVMPFDAVATPAGLTARAVSASAIELKWVDRSDNESGFVIERSGKKNGTYAVVGSVGAGVSVFRDTGLAAGTRYYYRVRAVSGAKTSGVTNRAVGRTLTVSGGK